MSAQPGSACLLAQSAQPGAAQLGGACLLEQAPISGTATIRAGCRAPWGVSRASARRTALRVAPTTSADALRRVPWHVPTPQATPSAVPWGVAAQADGAARARWGRFEIHVESPLVAPWGVASQADRAAVVPWGRYAGRPAVTTAPGWGRYVTHDLGAVVPWLPRVPIDLPIEAPWGLSRPRNPRWVLPWVRYSRQLNPGWGVVVEDGSPPTDEHGTVIVPVLEYYLVINEFSLVVAGTGQAVEVEDFSASIDIDSWCWGWSARLHADLMPLVMPPAPGESVELIASVNGTPLRLVVETIGRDRRFAASQLRIGGRGRAAWLADPFAPVESRLNTESRTAQQLLADALTINGASIGWSIDWRITDWLVPAGAWSHTGTYMDAARRIAEAGGAYVQAHNTDETLIILPRYPAAPWNWSGLTPDIELPEDVVEVEGIEWQDRPDYNAVWVSGAAGGRRDRIRRAGFAADRVAPTIVDPLATAHEMTLQRGTAVLGDTGRQAHITLRLPVLPETGIIQPGALVRYVESGNERIGLARGVQIEQRFPELWQSIRLETHE